MKHPTNDVPQTPALIVDEQIVERNLAKLANYAAGHGLRIRPHTKTHKSIEMAKRQLKHGALGVTAAKVGEAAVMAQISDDVLLAYPAIDSPRCNALAELARNCTVRVAVDSLEAVAALATAARRADSEIGILVDVDVGMHRTGVQTPAASLALAQAADQHSSLRLDGLFCYPGQVWAPASAQAQPLGAIAALLDETLDLWTRNGLRAAIVSGGSTPTAYQSHLIPRLTEIRPGTYIYNDANTVAGGFCRWDDCAASVVCTVVSNAVPGKVVIDAGTKALTSDRNVPSPETGFGHVREHPSATVVRLSEEHGEIDITQCERAPRLGERVHVIPNHICPCVNLQDTIWLRTADASLYAIPIDTRGKLS